LNGVDTGVELTKPLYNALIDIAEHRLDREGLAVLLRELLT
jgi:predicted DNA-binding ribbon-helix-helix protein